MSHLIALIFVLASAYIGSAIFSLLLGIILAYCIKLPDNFITKKIGSKFIQIGIILLAFSIPIYDAFEITKLFIPSIAIFVVSILLLGFIIGKFFNLKRNEIILITSGTAICGATAIAAIAPTLWLIPLMIALSIFYDRKTSFKMPIFVLIFLSVLFLNSYLFIDATTLLFIDNVSNLFLFSGLFCIGTSINKQSMLSLNHRVIFHALTLWVIAILLSYILVSYVL